MRKLLKDLRAACNSPFWEKLPHKNRFFRWVTDIPFLFTFFSAPIFIAAGALEDAHNICLLELARIMKFSDRDMPCTKWSSKTVNLPVYQIPWWHLPHNQGQGHQVQALLVRKRQRHCWCRTVCGRRVDRESFWGSESLWQNYFSETHSRPASGYLSVCVCPTEWSKWWG